MNHIYKLVWSCTSRTWVAVAESAAGRGKTAAGKVVGAAAVVGAAMLVTATFTAPAWAAGPTVLPNVPANTLPTGGAVSAGSATFSQSGATLTVQQATQQTAINWQSFNIGSAATVNFKQPNSASVALNRINGTEASQIYGHLNANGQVFLLNPNGMLFAPGSQVNVGGLLASTLKLSDTDFMAGNYKLTGPGSGSIVNLGSINASGSIAMVGNTVQNAGQLYATTVTLAAGNTVAVDLTGDGLIRARVTDAVLSADIENSGSINATASVSMTAGQVGNTVTQVVNNTGMIRATGLSQEGGQIVLQGGTVSNSGTITASGSQGGGHIELMGGMTTGSVNVGGTLDASAPQSGNGGSIETSAEHVSIADGVGITTAAAHGKNGNWLIDPVDFTVAATGGDITGAALGTLLATNSVIIQTATGTNTATNLYANGSTGTGDINVNDAVSWGTNTELTLNAFGNININQPLTATGAGGTLNMLYGQGAVAAGNTSVVHVNAPINLMPGPNYRTTLGSDGSTNVYYLITSLGAAADASSAPSTMTLQGIAAVTGFIGNFALGANIDAAATSGWNSGAGFTPIGNAGSNFSGIFDGLGHTVSNLMINQPTGQNIGLFGQISSTATVNNVGMANANITGLENVGGVVGLNQGTVSNVYSTGSVTATALSGLNLVPGKAGGVVGRNEDRVSNSYSEAAVSGLHAGGFVGSNLSFVTNSYSNGAVSGGTNGGFAGYNSFVITNGFWDTTTSGQSVGVGSGSTTGTTGLTTAQMQTASSFVGWDVATAGGSASAWRIYQGHTAPLLRSFLTPLNLTGAADTSVVYNGITQNAGSFSLVGSVFGGPATGTHVGLYNGYYSNQSGYDITGGNLTITPAPLTVTASISGTTTKVYDGTAAAPGAFITSNVTGAVPGDTITLNTSSVTLAYDSAHVASATNIAATGVTSLSIGGTVGSASTDYSYSQPTIAPLAATITQAPLTASAIVTGASTKVYDGTTAAPGAVVTGGTFSGQIAGDTLNFLTTGITLSYNSAHVASASSIGATGSAGFTFASSTAGSLVSDYSVPVTTVTPLAATITQAPLAYVADTVALLPGQALPTVLTGSVSGFVPGDTLSNATTGALSFFAPQTANFIAGNSYAIEGRGLTALDYVLTQADTNATALLVFSPQQVTQAVSASIAQTSATTTGSTSSSTSTSTSTDAVAPTAGALSFVLVASTPTSKSGGQLVNNNLPGTSVLVCK